MITIPNGSFVVEFVTTSLNVGFTQSDRKVAVARSPTLIAISRRPRIQVVISRSCRRRMSAFGRLRLALQRLCNALRVHRANMITRTPFPVKINSTSAGVDLDHGAVRPTADELCYCSIKKCRSFHTAELSRRVALGTRGKFDNILNMLYWQS